MLKKRLLRVSTLAMAFALVMVSALATGCNTPVTTAPPTTAAPTSDALVPTPAATAEPFTVDWFINYPGYVNAHWPERGSLVGDLFYEKTGATVNVRLASTDTGEEISTLVASDSMPDILTFSASTQDALLVKQLSDAGSLISYQELDTLNPGLLAACRPSVLKYYTQPDGKVYVYPGWASSDEDAEKNPFAKMPSAAVTMRKDLWEQLGKPGVTTPQGWLDACRRAVEEIQTYDGQKIIGMWLHNNGKGVRNILNQYFAVPFETPDGNYANVWEDQRNKETLKFLNDAYRMGLILESNFSDTLETLNEQIVQGRVFSVIGGGWGGQWYQRDQLYDKDTKAIYFPPILRNAAGDDPLLLDAQSWGGLRTGCTISAEQPDLVSKLFAFLISDEGLIASYWGVEGKMYYEDENGYLNFTQEYLDNVAAKDTDQYFGKYAHFDIFRNGSYLYARRAPNMTEKYNLTQAIFGDLVPYTIPAKNLLIPDNTDPRIPEMNDLQTRINQYLDQMEARMITAGSDAEFESLYEETVVGLKDLGNDTLIAYYNEQFQRAKKFSGVEHLWPKYE